MPRRDMLLSPVCEWDRGKNSENTPFRFCFFNVKTSLSHPNLPVIFPRQIVTKFVCKKFMGSLKLSSYMYVTVRYNLILYNVHEPNSKACDFYQWNETHCLWYILKIIEPWAFRFIIIPPGCVKWKWNSLVKIKMLTLQKYIALSDVVHKIFTTSWKIIDILEWLKFLVLWIFHEEPCENITHIFPLPKSLIKHTCMHF